MQQRIDRRGFLQAALAGGTGVALDLLFARYASADNWAHGRTPWGPLGISPEVDGERVALALPPGFQYRILSSYGRRLSDGTTLPENPDGMGAFDVGGFIRLVRNHEVRLSGVPLGTGPFYDARAAGGTTTVVVDPATRRIVRDFVSLSGTVTNCSGGPTPWNSWLSCEESIDGTYSGFEKQHGYCFEVAAASEGPVPPIALTRMGCFNHEAAIVDPRTGLVFMTEDERSAGFYRFVPNVPGRLIEGGRLQMLAVTGQPRYDTIAGQLRGQPLTVHWIDIPDPDPRITALGQQPVYDQGRERGGARFRRLEGAAFGNEAVWFAATTGGDRELGQIWRYRPFVAGGAGWGVGSRRRRAVRHGWAPPESGGELRLVYESADATTLKAPDNVHVSPRGSLIICEDSTLGAQYLRCLAPSGELFDLAQNAVPGLEHSEFAGAVFSGDGQTLFVNIYGPAMTIAIWGPWGSLV